MAETVTPEVGELTYDTKRDRVGEVMGNQAGRVLLRLFGGGVEWEANPDELRPAHANERLRARVNEMDTRRF
ncbi:hypothetical protein AV521_16330 [Streptomyces sp. IMTB 2501]|uniref:hypothetical protein n=1 Tax=Streptomyces sp. IMTB 2501 TaxID=1776340 RepID=UPI00096CFB23|nr:hypothetical protein [Streptomyces sp. IMTB 2501]OLZ69905.1 hypothetical protein AV521_16330 [Streptomyces sp. IMTB 2501]